MVMPPVPHTSLLTFPPAALPASSHASTALPSHSPGPLQFHHVAWACLDAAASLAASTARRMRHPRATGMLPLARPPRLILPPPSPSPGTLNPAVCPTPAAREPGSWS